MEHWILWVVFAVVLIVMVALDLGLFSRGPKVIGVREALLRTAGWVGLAMAFNALLFWREGPEHAGEFLVCYLTELALSVDNIFVFIIILKYFAVPPASQHRVLVWGILGAVALRALFILAGAELVSRFSWSMYPLGAFLIYTGIKLVTTKEGSEFDPEKNFVLRLIRRFVPLSKDHTTDRFFVVEDGKRLATYLLVALIVVDFADIMFAVDSVPAALAITKDRFILYTSNVFAILGLRSMFFAVAGIIPFLHYLQHGLALILVFIGTKMMVNEHVHIPIPVSLGVVAGVLGLSVLASVVRTRRIRRNKQE
ncbi:MAG TPA: TerC family protein [Planctomycetota bacterium]|nr:TerC family protein [Planctomycetota bacterium]